MADTIVQYVVVRTDLITALDWTVGAVIAQACHATTAAAQEYKDDEHTKQYFSDVNNMHKIVLGISSEVKLKNLSKRLTDFFVEHRVWVELPEDIPTCLVTKPAPKGNVAEFFKKLQLFRLSNGNKKKKNKREDDDEGGKRGDEREDGKGGGDGDEGEGNKSSGDDTNRNDGDEGDNNEEGEDKDLKEQLKESARAEMEERMSNSPKLPPISKHGL